MSPSLPLFLSQWHSSSPTMEVRTSGSTGKPKVLHVEKSRMLASARMTCDFLGLSPGDSALLCMPLDYIAGKMMVVRSLERGLRLMCVEPSGHPLCTANLRALGLPLGTSDMSDMSDPSVPSVPSTQSPQCHRPSIDLAAMVPLQVFNTLQIPEEREALCRHVRHLIIGGGAIPPELEQELSTLPVIAWSSYGMTETLSHIALRRIGDPWYTPLPGISLARDTDGCLIIDAPALCPERLFTNDIAEFFPGNINGSCLDEIAKSFPNYISKSFPSDTAEYFPGDHLPDTTPPHASVRFRILGRRDNTVCSGGIKIQIEEVESWLRSLGLHDITVTWRPDPRLGQALVYLTTTDIDIDRLRAITEHSCPNTTGCSPTASPVCPDQIPACPGQISVCSDDSPASPNNHTVRPDTRYWFPRAIIHVDALPLTPTGKPDRAQARQIAEQGMPDVQYRTDKA